MVCRWHRRLEASFVVAVLLVVAVTGMAAFAEDGFAVALAADASLGAVSATALLSILPAAALGACCFLLLRRRGGRYSSEMQIVTKSHS